MSSFAPKKIKAAIKHLKASDSVMRCCIEEVGAFTLQVNPDRFRMLVRSIIAQQISTAAARTILERLEQKLAPEGVTADSLSRLTPRQLKSVGVSPQKAKYLDDLTKSTQSGTLQLKQIGRLSDQRIIEQLTEVKGIGVWTAQMFLIFSLGRLDVLPHDDLGIRTAIRNQYQLEALPNKVLCHEIATPWRPFASVASWYCWRSLDLKKKQ